MLHRLPLEIICEVLLICARDLVVTDRATAARIALVSRTAYRIVRPTLYRTLVITRQNARGNPNSLKSVLPYVCYLHSTLYEHGAEMPADALTWTAYINKHWHPANNGFLDAPWGFVLAYLEAAPGARLGVRINYMSLADAFTFLPRGDDQLDQLAPKANQSATGIRSVARAVGYQPIFYPGLQLLGEDKAALWAKGLLEAGSALADIGIIAQRMHFQGLMPQYGCATKAIARALLSSPRVRSLCFRYVGDLATQEAKDELSGFVQEVADPRLRIVVDERARRHISPGRSIRIEIDDIMNFWDPLPMDEASVYRAA